MVLRAMGAGHGHSSLSGGVHGATGREGICSAREVEAARRATCFPGAGTAVREFGPGPDREARSGGGYGRGDRIPLHVGERAAQDSDRSATDAALRARVNAALQRLLI